MALSLARAGSLKANMEYSDVADAINDAKKVILEQKKSKQGGKKKQTDTEVIDAPDAVFGQSPYFNELGQNANQQVRDINLQATLAQSQAETDADVDLVVASTQQAFGDITQNIKSTAAAGKNYDTWYSEVGEDVNLQYDDEFLNAQNSGNPDDVNNLIFDNFYKGLDEENKKLLDKYKKGDSWDWDAIAKSGLSNQLGRTQLGTYVGEEGAIYPGFSFKKSDIAKLDPNQVTESGFNEGVKEPNATFQRLNLEDAKMLSEGLAQSGINPSAISNITTLLTSKNIGFNNDIVIGKAGEIYNKYEVEFQEAGITKQQYIRGVKNKLEYTKLKGDFQLVTLSGNLTDDKLKSKLGLYDGLYIYNHSRVVMNKALDDTKINFTDLFQNKQNLELSDGTPLPLYDNDPKTADFMQLMSEGELMASERIGDGGNDIKGKFQTIHQTKGRLINRTSTGGVIAMQPLATAPDNPSGTQKQTIAGGQLYLPSINAQIKEEYTRGENNEPGAIKLGGPSSIYSQGKKDGTGGKARPLSRIDDFPETNDDEVQLKNELYMMLDNEFGATPVQAYQGYAFKNPNGSFTVLDSENFNQAVSAFNNQSGNVMNDIVPVIIQQYNVSNVNSQGNRIIESISNDFISACTINEYNEAMAVELTKNYSDAQGVVNKIVVDEKKQNIIGSDAKDGGMTNSMNALTN